MLTLITKLISGGQTGADRGGLEAGKRLRIETGGHCPANYKTENGPDYSLKEFGLICTVSSDYPIRTNLNIRNSDGTIIFGKFESGTKLTENICKANETLYFPVKFDHISQDSVWILQRQTEFVSWIHAHNINCLNVAGNRESKFPGIQKFVEEFLVECLVSKK
jgi:hypothetical protein